MPEEEVREQENNQQFDVSQAADYQDAGQSDDYQDAGQSEDYQDDASQADQQQDQSGEKKKETPPYRGWYAKVNVSTKALDAVIIGCIVVIIVTVAINLLSPGYNITFDSKGGSDVAYQQCMYGDYVEEPEEPTREGYVFGGWYQDEGYDIPWDFEVDTVTGDITLYALWLEAD